MIMNNPLMMISYNPMPFMLNMNLICMMIQIMNKIYYMNKFIITITIMMNIMIIFTWIYMLMYKKMFKGYYSFMLSLTYKFTMMITIMSELIFFLSFFYMLLNNKFMMMMYNSYWYINNFYLNFYISLMNTILLLTSSLTISLSFMILMKKKLNFLFMYKMTLMMSMYFITIQIYEFFNIKFCFNNSMFWSLFFILTSFHMLHVFMGLMMMMMYIMNFYKFMFFNTMILKIIIWYWHFIDMIWIIIFMLIY